MVTRIGYLTQLYSWKDEDVIKVVIGLRRCGKSTLDKFTVGNYEGIKVVNVLGWLMQEH